MLNSFSPHMGNLERLVNIINMHLRSYTTSKIRELEGVVVGDPWTLMDIDEDLRDKLAILYTVRCHLRGIPHTRMELVEFDGIRVPQISLVYEEELLEDTVNRSELLKTLGSFISFIGKFALP